jgi:hypothetical protein
VPAELYRIAPLPGVLSSETARLWTYGRQKHLITRFSTSSPYEWGLYKYGGGSIHPWLTGWLTVVKQKLHTCHTTHLRAGCGTWHHHHQCLSSYMRE